MCACICKFIHVFCVCVLACGSVIYEGCLCLPILKPLIGSGTLMCNVYFVSTCWENYCKPVDSNRKIYKAPLQLSLLMAPYM